MKRMAVALVALGLLAAGSVVAQTSAGHVTLYGRLNLGVDNYRATGGNCAPGVACDLKSRARIFDSFSRLGVRGTEQLGGGFRAFFQIESGANVDSGGQTGQGGQQNVSTGFLASRESFVGLEGGAGKLSFGRQSFWWVNGTNIQTSLIHANTEVPFFSAASFGRVAMNIARQSNTIQYLTPAFGGANLLLSYSPDSTPGAGFVNSESRQGGQNTNARMWGATLRWARGPVSLQGDYAQKETASDAVAAARPKNKGWKALGAFSYMPGSQVSAIFSRVENENSAAFGVQTDDLTQNMWGVEWIHTLGNVVLMAQYGQLGKISGCTLDTGFNSCSETRARAYGVGARYLFSKRTSVYLTYNRVNNERNQFADYTAGSITSNNGATGSTATGFGNDPQIVALGVRHDF